MSRLDSLETCRTSFAVVGCAGYTDRLALSGLCYGGIMVRRQGTGDQIGRSY